MWHIFPICLQNLNLIHRKVSFSTICVVTSHYILCCMLCTWDSLIYFKTVRLYKIVQYFQERKTICFLNTSVKGDEIQNFEFSKTDTKNVQPKQGLLFCNSCHIKMKFTICILTQSVLSIKCWTMEWNEVPALYNQ